MIRRLTLLPFTFSLMVTLAACGDDPDISGEGTADGPGEHTEEVGGAERTEECTEQARAAAEDFLRALRDGDGETGCALIDEDAHASVTLTTTNSQAAMETECEPAFSVYAERFKGAGVARISEVEMGTDSEGEIPIVTVHLDYTEDVAGQTVDDLRFWLMDDGEWRIRTVPFGGP